AAGEAALLHTGRLAGLDLVEKALAMWSYILKRLLLMVPTLFGILLITFVVIQFVPGGPVEQMVAQLQGRDMAGGEAGGRTAAAAGLGRYRGRQGAAAGKIGGSKELSGFEQ